MTKLRYRIVLPLALQKVSTHVNEVDLFGPAFCNRSENKQPYCSKIQGKCKFNLQKNVY